MARLWSRVEKSSPGHAALKGLVNEGLYRQADPVQEKMQQDTA
jgi:hypothetical protein